MSKRKVKIEAIRDASGAIDFEVDGTKANASRIKFEKDSGPHTIEFQLKDRTGSGLEFDLSDPIWVGEDCPCPPPRGIASDQLSVDRCSADKLSARNANEGRARELRYQLNFRDASGGRQECDPVITNGGGTRV